MSSKDFFVTLTPLWHPVHVINWAKIIDLRLFSTFKYAVYYMLGCLSKYSFMTSSASKVHFSIQVTFWLVLSLLKQVDQGQVTWGRLTQVRLNYEITDWLLDTSVLEWIPRKMLSFEISNIQEICRSDLILITLAVIFNSIFYLINHNFFLEIQF